MKALFDQIEQAMLPHTLEYSARIKVMKLCNDAEKENAELCEELLHNYHLKMEPNSDYRPKVTGPHVVNGFDPYEHGLEE